MDLLSHENMQVIVGIIGSIFAYIGILVMIIGGIKAVYLLICKRFFNHQIPVGKIRIKLGHYLVLALEFLVAKDILESIVNPTTEGLITLGAIVLIRTVLSYFLNKEISEVKEEIKYYEEEVKARETSKKSKKKTTTPKKK